jgi:hypothetical protein
LSIITILLGLQLSISINISRVIEYALLRQQIA